MAADQALFRAHEQGRHSTVARAERRAAEAREEFSEALWRGCPSGERLVSELRAAR